MARDETTAGGTGETGAALRRRRAPRRAAAEQRERTLSGRAWQDFCAALERAGRQLGAFPVPDREELRAEAFRYLLGLGRSGIDQALQLSDPDQPRFVRNPDTLAKWGAENADNQYLWAAVRPDASYRIEGLRRSAFDFLLEVKDGYMQLGDDRVFASATAGELEVAPDGRFEILLSAERPAGFDGNWLPIHRDGRYVTVRQYFVDWEREEPARFEIFRVGGEGEPPAPLSAARMGELLDSAGEWTEQTARFWTEWVEQLRSGWRRDAIAPPRHFVGGADAIHYGNDWFRLGPDEALVVECEVPDARYWQIQLCDVWFRTMDYATRQTSLNQAQIRVDGDRRFRVVIAHEDPGVPNWLDTAGHPEGMIQYRFVWARSCPRPRARTVPFAELSAHLPADTPSISPAERRRALATRQRHVLRREPCT
jgi:hypothetical protein